jgi:hypothetical protein
MKFFRIFQQRDLPQETISGRISRTLDLAPTSPATPYMLISPEWKINRCNTLFINNI